jgi:hypothetical protein
MDYENERYVRVYVTETVNFLCLPWQSRMLLRALTPHFDRAGLIDIGEHEPVKAVAAKLRCPEHFVSVGLSPLFRGPDSPWELREHDGRRFIFWPNFTAGQEAKQSDRQRSKASRERRRDFAKRAAVVTDCDVTKRDGGVRGVSDDPVQPPKTPPKPRDAPNTDGNGTGTLWDETDANVTKPSPSSNAMQCIDPPCSPPLGDTPAPKAKAKAKAKRKRAGPMPSDFGPDDTHRTMAADAGLNVAAELADFQDWTTAKGSTYTDWAAAFRSHLRRKAERPKPWSAPPGRQAHDQRKAAHTGDPLADMVAERTAAWEREEAEQREASKARAEKARAQLAEAQPLPPPPPKPLPEVRPVETKAEQDARIEAERQRQQQALARMVAEGGDG